VPKYINPGHLPGLLVIFAGSLLTAYLAANRTHFTFGTETDYLAGFIKEAQRIATGEPLRMSFHPPVYPFAVATVQKLTLDWFTTGLLISWSASVVVLITVYLIFTTVGNPVLACGSVIALLTSPVYLSYSALATSDLFFLALYAVTFLSVLLAIRSRFTWLWGMAGIFLGLTVLTRTNGLTIILLLGIPWLQPLALRVRTKHFFWLVVPFILLLMIWVVVALRTGSPYWPTDTYANLALTYFSDGPNRISGEGRKIVEQQFGSLWHVLAHDPAHLAQTYVWDAIQLARRVFTSNQLLIWPMNILSLAGMILLIGVNRNRNQVVYYLVLVTAAQLIVINLKAFDARFYLFFLPILGACAAYCLNIFATHLRRFRLIQCFAFALVSLLVLVEFRGSVRKARASIHASDAELGGVIATVKDLIERKSIIVARKPHVPFYMGGQHVGFPDVDSFQALKAEIMSQIKEPAYLYYGKLERSRRPQFDQLQTPDASPPWLKAVAQGSIPQNWVLYRIIPEDVEK
jgi:hypothetical protein